MTFLRPNTMGFFSLVLILSDLVALFDIVNYLPHGHPFLPSSLLLVLPSSLLLVYLLGPPSMPRSVGILPGLLSRRHPLSWSEPAGLWTAPRSTSLAQTLPLYSWISMVIPHLPCLKTNMSSSLKLVSFSHRLISNVCLRQMQAQSFGAISSTPVYSTHSDSQRAAAADPSPFWPPSPPHRSPLGETLPTSHLFSTLAF